MSHTVFGELLLLYYLKGSNGGRRYGLVFVNRGIVQSTSEESIDFFMDGTFRIVPRNGKFLNLRSSQVFNILADHHGTALCIFTVVMTSRKLPLYRKVFALISSKFPNFKPARMMSDYEPAMRKAFKETYNTTRMNGCR